MSNHSLNSPSETIASLVAPTIRALQPYHVPPADGLIKLDAMENPYRLPEGLRDSWLERLAGVAVNRYPDPACSELKRRLAKALKLPSTAGVVLGNGSDELIQMLCLLVGGPGNTVMAPSPSFSMYELIAVATGSEFVGVPLDDDFALDEPAMLAAIEKHRPSCLFLASPNNPTGNCFDPAVVDRLSMAAPGLVVVDEAYYPFSGRSLLDDCTRFPNRVVLRTLSKNGMAALRLGLLAGHPEWVEQLEKVRLPYNINSLSQASAEFYLDHYGVLQDQADEICRDRDELVRELTRRTGIAPFPSEANFILFRFDGDADQLHARLRDAGVLIKNLNAAGGVLAGCLRVSVGTGEENSRFIEALDGALAANSA